MSLDTKFYSIIIIFREYNNYYLLRYKIKYNHHSIDFIDFIDNFEI